MRVHLGLSSKVGGLMQGFGKNLKRDQPTLETDLCIAFGSQIESVSRINLQCYVYMYDINSRNTKFDSVDSVR